MNHTKKAQGTIEYLVIIAIVIVIALVVVGLLLQLMGQGTGVSETSAKATWKSAEPWAITDWALSSNTLTVVLKNNSSETLNFTDVYVAGQANSTSAGPIAPGATVNKAIASLNCTAGTKYAYPKSGIYIDYNGVAGINKKQYANADIVGTCS